MTDDTPETPEGPETHGPWQRHGTKEVYRSPWIRVYHDDVTTPGGTAGIYGRVCFHNKAVGVIPLDTDHHTWLVHQYRYTLGESSWEIPEGGCPEPDNLVEHARRELREETGLDADDWELLLRLHTSNSVTDEEAFIFVARDLRPGTAAPEASEGDLHCKRVPLDTAVQMVLDGRITDAMSVAGLLKLHLQLSLDG